MLLQMSISEGIDAIAGEIIIKNSFISFALENIPPLQTSGPVQLKNTKLIYCLPLVNSPTHVLRPAALLGQQLHLITWLIIL